MRPGRSVTIFLWFYYAAIEPALNTGERAAAERYVAALASCTRPEPLPWADFQVARGRALAGFGRGARDDARSPGCGGLRNAAERDGLQLMLPALQAARRCRGAGPGPGRERTVGIRCEFW